jgi:hypothetical protein
MTINLKRQAALIVYVKVSSILSLKKNLHLKDCSSAVARKRASNLSRTTLKTTQRVTQSQNLKFLIQISPLKKKKTVSAICGIVPSSKPRVLLTSSPNLATLIRRFICMELQRKEKSKKTNKL